MIEAAVSVTFGAIAGVAALTNRLHNRINTLHDHFREMDRRVDGIELRIAEKYVSKADLAAIIKSMEDHMVRIESKLDQLTLKT